MKTRIFFVEDDQNFGTVLKAYLEMNDFDVTLVDDGKNALSEFEKSDFDICVLDVMLPNVDGFSIARQIKDKNKNIPLIFLTAKILKQDILEGFKIGADDYITKPFDTEVLLYKIKAILNRNGASKTENDEYQIGDYNFDYKLRVLTHADKTQKLSPKESELLRMLCIYKDSVMPRKQALKSIWGNDSYFTTRSMDVFITKLRKYLKLDSRIEITNIHGSGYILTVNNQ